MRVSFGIAQVPRPALTGAVTSRSECRNSELGALGRLHPAEITAPVRHAICVRYRDADIGTDAMRQGHVSELANLDRRDPFNGKLIVDRRHARRDRHGHFRRGFPGLRFQRLAAADLSVDREAYCCLSFGHALNRDRERRLGDSRRAFGGSAFANGKKRAKWRCWLTDDRQVGRRSAVAQRFIERRGRCDCDGGADRRGRKCRCAS
ncbi:hypothetical protein BLA14095_06614 [Burkholderia lata]|nr:hypothetical protein BLA14095_06614 [Burkholderia lata]